ncbi:uncharacterized protein FOMMEDRAFT_155716 [Fomitiporia mediterranea MF3/22]|uniref:uncharacterized protein n=1 Tax=Fomitiporia mediterranea (strain MF3/22) TaxID=694068 RepID=UPI0004409420|nr:uncharacterized protein FOMMEDRAFT_155716 [Fomitiporia mediterranea MF3/22]EJD04561.1 hypothetical protein FOMMEDRAFT_155716 [Fomitiporia mediterranea MF3/22]
MFESGERHTLRHTKHADLRPTHLRAPTDRSSKRPSLEEVRGKNQSRVFITPRPDDGPSWSGRDPLTPYGPDDEVIELMALLFPGEFTKQWEQLKSFEHVKEAAWPEDAKKWMYQEIPKNFRARAYSALSPLSPLHYHHSLRDNATKLTMSHEDLMISGEYLLALFQSRDDRECWRLYQFKIDAEVCWQNKSFDDLWADFIAEEGLWELDLQWKGPEDYRNPITSRVQAEVFRRFSTLKHKPATHARPHHRSHMRIR